MQQSCGNRKGRSTLALYPRSYQREADRLLDRKRQPLIEAQSEATKRPNSKTPRYRALAVIGSLFSQTATKTSEMPAGSVSLEHVQVSTSAGSTQGLWRQDLGNRASSVQ